MSAKLKVTRDTTKKFINQAMEKKRSLVKERAKFKHESLKPYPPLKVLFCAMNAKF